MQKWLSYTKAEAMALEDHYIKGYEAEGLTGKGRMPDNTRWTVQCFNLTAAGIARQEKAKQERDRAYQILKDGGPQRASDIKRVMDRSDTAVRKYMRGLEEEGRARVVHTGKTGVITWEAI